jgi:hypothetical protein
MSYYSNTVILKYYGIQLIWCQTDPIMGEFDILVGLADTRYYHRIHDILPGFISSIFRKSKHTALPCPIARLKTVEYDHLNQPRNWLTVTHFDFYS